MGKINKLKKIDLKGGGLCVGDSARAEVNPFKERKG